MSRVHAVTSKYTHMVLYTLYTDPAHHMLSRTDDCTHGQLKVS